MAYEDKPAGGGDDKSRLQRKLEEQRRRNAQREEAAKKTAGLATPSDKPTPAMTVIPPDKSGVVKHEDGRMVMQIAMPPAQIITTPVPHTEPMWVRAVVEARQAALYMVAGGALWQLFGKLVGG